MRPLPKRAWLPTTNVNVLWKDLRRGGGSISSRNDVSNQNGCGQDFFLSVLCTCLNRAQAFQTMWNVKLLNYSTILLCDCWNCHELSVCKLLFFPRKDAFKGLSLELCRPARGAAGLPPRCKASGSRCSEDSARGRRHPRRKGSPASRAPRRHLLSENCPSPLHCQPGSGIACWKSIPSQTSNRWAPAAKESLWPALWLEAGPANPRRRYPLVCKKATCCDEKDVGKHM